MKKNLIVPLTVIILSVFIFSGCNESGNIWAKYTCEDFCTTVRYGRGDKTVCARVSVSRSEKDEVSVEFSSPDALRGAVGSYDGADFHLTCGGIEISGEPAKSILRIPIMLAARDALYLERSSEGERRLLIVGVEGGKIIFDIESGDPIRAELDGTECEMIIFEWSSRAT